MVKTKLSPEADTELFRTRLAERRDGDIVAKFWGSSGGAARRFNGAAANRERGGNVKRNRDGR
jgi:hypothetical protein